MKWKSEQKSFVLNDSIGGNFESAKREQEEKVRREYFNFFVHKQTWKAERWCKTSSKRIISKNVSIKLHDDLNIVDEKIFLSSKPPEKNIKKKH